MNVELATTHKRPILTEDNGRNGSIENAEEQADAVPDCDNAEIPEAPRKTRKRRTNEEISFSGRIKNAKKRREKSTELCQHADRKLTELSRRCGGDFLLVVVDNNSINIKTNDALDGLGAESWLDLHRSIPAYLAQSAAQERIARQSGRFKDQTFAALNRPLQNKVLEVMLDVSIKNRKGVLAYSTSPTLEKVRKLASWWPEDVPYAAPRSMTQEHLGQVFAALVQHSDSSDDLLMRKLKACVGSLGIEKAVQLSILAAMRHHMKEDVPPQRSPEDGSEPESGSP